jgi:membrane associated rhomboid family serine protease
MNNTANPPDQICTLEEVCGFGGFHGQNPNQTFRFVNLLEWCNCTASSIFHLLIGSFITPIFLHAGIIHLLLNMLAQMILSAQIEREMGSGGFIITYFAAGIFGYV